MVLTSITSPPTIKCTFRRKQESKYKSEIEKVFKSTVGIHAEVSNSTKKRGHTLPISHKNVRIRPMVKPCNMKSSRPMLKPSKKSSAA